MIRRRCKKGDISDKLPILNRSLKKVEKELKLNSANFKDQVDNMVEEVMGKLKRLMQVLQQLSKFQIDLQKSSKEEEEKIKKEREREKEEYEYDFNKSKKTSRRRTKVDKRKC